MFISLYCQQARKPIYFQQQTEVRSPWRKKENRKKKKLNKKLTFTENTSSATPYATDFLMSHLLKG